VSYGIYRARGDYGVLRGQRGDPIFGALAGIVGSGLIPKVGKVIGKLGGLFGKKVGPTLPAVIGGAVGGRLLPGKMPFLPDVGVGKRRRRMNPGNSKALNRAIRRVSSFGNLVQRSKKSVAKANRALNPGRGSRGRRAPVC